MKKLLPYLLLSPLAILSSSVTAAQCKIRFNYGVITAPNQIRFLDQERTYMQINNGNQLFVHGKQVELTSEQELAVGQYMNGVQDQVQSIVSLSIESVDIGLKAVNKVIGSLTGENSQSHQKVQKKFEELQWSHRKRFNHSDDSFFIAPQDFDDFDEIFKGEFEQELEEIITQSLGTILVAVGEAMSNREEDSLENRTDGIEDRLATLGNELEVEVTSRAKALETRASAFCSSINSLNAVETRLINSVPELATFDLIRFKDNASDEDISQ